MAIGTTRHKLLTGDNVGSIVRWTVADSTARLALSLTADDNGSVAKQTNDNSYHVLANYVTPTWVQLGNVTTNTSAATSPTINDDELLGYTEGDIWINTATDAVYVLVDKTAGAAIWTLIGALGVAWGAISGTLSAQTDLQSALDAKSNTGHTHDDRYYTETEVNDLLALVKPIELSGAVDPGVSTGNGKALGTIYVNTTADTPHFLVDNTTDANVWSAGGGGGGGGTWGSITGTLSAQTDLQSALDAKVAGPASATDTAIARFDGTTGKLLKDGALATVSDDAHLRLLGADPAIDLAERAAAPTHQLARGHYWTKNTSPTTPWFTNSIGGSSQLNDHGSLAGLTDDDHAQYLLANGTRALTGNLSVSALATIDGRDLSVDGAKLDGIEAGADVTDTANVTAAGALMDSEVDADIKTLSLPANTTISAFGASLVDDANAAAAIATLGLDADIATLALPASTTISAFGATLVDDADAATARTTLGVARRTTYNTVMGRMGGPTTTNWYTSPLNESFDNDVDWDTVVGLNSSSTPVADYVDYIDGSIFTAPYNGTIKYIGLSVRPLIAQDWTFIIYRQQWSGTGGTFTEIDNSGSVSIAAGWNDFDLTPASLTTLSKGDGLGFLWTISDAAPAASDLACRIYVTFEES